MDMLTPKRPDVLVSDPDRHAPCGFYPVRGATKQMCQKRCQEVADNRATCWANDCESPWRFCVSCARDKRDHGLRLGPEHCVVDVEKGLCQFHLDNGEDAVRGESTPAVTLTEDISSAEVVPATVPVTSKAIKPLPVRKEPEQSAKPKQEKKRGRPARVSKEAPDLSDEERLTGRKLFQATHLNSPKGGFRIPVRDIRPMKGQPREYFDQEALTWLAGSIQAVGQIQPVLVKELPEGSTHPYELVDGQRRWHAAQMVGKTELLAVVVNAPNFREQFLISAIANFGQVQNTDVEKAKAYQFARTEFGMTISDVARAFNIAIMTVSNHLALLKLDPRVLDLMGAHLPKKKQLGQAVALQLIGYEPDDQYRMAKVISDAELDTNRARAYIRSEVVKHGLARSGARKRKPADDYQHCLKLLQTGYRKLGDVLAYGDTHLESLLQRGRADLIDTVENLLDLIDKRRAELVAIAGRARAKRTE